jgi:hypothetical protein
MDFLKIAKIVSFVALGALAVIKPFVQMDENIYLWLVGVLGAIGGTLTVNDHNTSK